VNADRRIFVSEPWIRLADLRFFGAPRWEELDEVASAWLGRPCLALPSIRVGLCWTFEHLGYARHRDHVLVPRFVGRCILNSLSRFVFPVETPTAETRIALVVDQFGLRQNLAVLHPEFERRSWAYIEDSPYGIGDDETPGAGSLGRFIGLGKVLPVVQGALLVTDDDSLRKHVGRKRDERSMWSWPVWLTMLALRRRHVGGYSAAGDAAYEMYLAARGGNAWLRGNLAEILSRIDTFARASQVRLAAIADALGNRVLLPDQGRLGYLVPFLAGAVFRRHGFDDTPLHVDVQRNMLTPQYVKSLLIPVNPRVQSTTFDALLSALQSLGSGNSIVADVTRS